MIVLGRFCIGSAAQQGNVRSVKQLRMDDSPRVMQRAACVETSLVLMGSAFHTALQGIQGGNRPVVELPHSHILNPRPIDRS